MDTQELVLTSAGLLELLASIDEFEDFDLGLSEGLDGEIQLRVNDSVYAIGEATPSNEIEVDDEAFEEIEAINDAVYDTLEDKFDVETAAPIESGPIKELVKTLLLGGAVRLGKHLLTD